MSRALPFVVVGGIDEGVGGYVHGYASSLPSVPFIEIFPDDIVVKLHPNFLLKSVSFWFMIS